MTDRFSSGCGDKGRLCGALDVKVIERFMLNICEKNLRKNKNGFRQDNVVDLVDGKGG